METEAGIIDQVIFADTSRIIGAALEHTHRENALAAGIAPQSFEMAMRQLVEVWTKQGKKKGRWAAGSRGIFTATVISVILGK